MFTSAKNIYRLLQIARTLARHDALFPLEESGIARGMIGAVAPVVGQLSGPVGSAVGAAVGAGAQALGQYDRLKMEAMNQGNQVANVGAAIKRGMG